MEEKDKSFETKTREMRDREIYCDILPYLELVF